VSDGQYLSIGEVLGLLLEDFPDVTISKIRFLESQGLIEPERTPSGYRKFYDHDVDLLRAILHEQRENFLPLKVIRDRIESGSLEGDPTGARTPPRGIRNVEVRQGASTVTSGSNVSPSNAAHSNLAHSNLAHSNLAQSNLAQSNRAYSAETSPINDALDPRDSVFRRTDGGPEWADGRALIPGSKNSPKSSAPTPITTSVPITPVVPQQRTPAAPLTGSPTGAPTSTGPTSTDQAAPSANVGFLATPPTTNPVEVALESAPPATVFPPKPSGPTAPSRSDATAPVAPVTEVLSTVVSNDSPAKDSPHTSSPAGDFVPYNREEFCAAAHITLGQLDELESYGLIGAKGTGRDATYSADALEIATVAGRFLANGIDARHLRSWKQSADRECALFEQRIMPLLRQRNPASRHAALDTLTDLSGLGGRLRQALVDAALRHHFDGV
jgi:DNA-binding transcriptional MerR regulator